MRISRNRIIALILTVVGVSTVFAGCSKKDGGAVKANAKTVQEITFWYGLGGKLGENMQEKIKSFNSSQKSVVVKGIAQGSYDETYQSLQAAIAANKAPTAVLLDSGKMNALANKNVLVPLDDFINSDSSYNPDDLVASFYQQGKVNGKMYSLPMYGTTQIMYYRKDYLKAAGIDPESIKTWQDLYSASAKLKKTKGSDVSVYGFEPMWGADNLTDMALSDGGQLLSSDGKTVTINSKPWVESWDAVRKAIFEDKTMRIHSGGQGWAYWYATIDDVMKDRAAGYLGSSGDQGDLDFKKIVAVPQPGFNSNSPKPVAGGISAAIPAAITDKEQQKAAFKWIEYFESPEQTADWSMKSGYIAVRKSAAEVSSFKDYAKENPQILVPLKQAQYASSPFVDPTGGKITDALSKAADKVEIQNIPAQKALDDAQKEAQAALESMVK